MSLQHLKKSALELKMYIILYILLFRSQESYKYETCAELHKFHILSISHGYAPFDAVETKSYQISARIERTVIQKATSWTESLYIRL